MSWRDQYQQGSLAGITFYTTSSDAEFGRRTVTHEFPLQDKPWSEDLGRKARKFSLEMILLGDDYRANRDALIQKLESGGSHELIHPYYGSMQVSLDDNGSATVSESTAQGGFARISASFVEAGEQLFPTATTQSTSKANNDVAAMRAAIASNFAESVQITNQAGFVADSFIDDLNARLTAFETTLNGLDAPIEQVRDTLVKVGQLRANSIRLIRKPFDIADQVLQIAELITGGLNLDNLLVGFERVTTLTERQPAPIQTPSRIAQEQNANAMDVLQLGAGLVGTITRLIELTPADSKPTASPFGSINEALEIRDQIIAQLEQLKQIGNDDLYLKATDMQGSFYEHIEAHGINLRRIINHETKTTQPALVIAHDLYGDASRDQEIINRNGIAHDGFIQPQSLEVLDA